MKKVLRYLLYSLLFFLPASLMAQATLVTSPYTENFDNVGTSLPSGFSIYTGATTSSIGTAATLTTTATLWNNATGAFKNFASATGLAYTATTEQAASTNRALGLRQTGTVGDPGGAFVFQVTNTTGKTGFKLSFALQSLDGVTAPMRATAWTVDYSLPGSPTTFTGATVVGSTGGFTGAANTNNGATYTNNTVTVDFGNALDNQTGVVTIRVVTLAGTTGSNVRPSTGIDDWSLTWSSPATTPTLTATTTPATTPTSIDFGTTQTVNTISTAKTFSLAGTNIPAAGVTLAVATPYSISTDNGSTYGLTGSYTQAQMASAQTVSVKFSPTLTTATPGTVAIASGTATATVALTGTGAAAAVVPSLAPSTTTVAFGNVNTTATPPVLSYTLSGANLGANNTVLTASGAPYLISKLAAGPFSTTLTYLPAEIALTPSVYVQFSPTAAGAATGTITMANGAVASPATVNLSGTGVVPTLTPSVSTVAFGNATINTTSNSQSFTIAGSNLTGAVSIAVIIPTSPPVSPTTFQISTDGGTVWTTTALITTFVSPQTVLVRYTPAALGASTGFSISISSSGATTQSVALTGSGVSAPVPTLTLAPTSLTFSGLVGSLSAAQSYTITGANISGASTVTVAAPYSISKTSTGTYGTNLAYTTADFPSGSGVQTVFVKFNPTVVAVGGVNNGTAVNATASGTNQNVTLNGTGIGVPLLAAAPSTLAFSQVIGGTSAAQNFTITGTYLTASTTVTATGPYTISKTSTGGYAASLTYTTGELASPVTVYVQFSPTVVAAGGVNNGNVAIASTGATTQNVTLTGTGLAVPTLTASTTPATTPTSIAFPVQSITATSAGLPFTLTGANITAAATTVTVAAPYQVSKTSVGGYASSITYNATEMATPQTVYVNFAPSTKTLFNGTVTIASTGATSATVTLTGTGIDPPNVAPTLAAIADPAPICYTTAVQNIALSGISPVETAQITTVSVSSSNPALFASMGILPLTASTATLTYTFNPGVSGTAIVSVTVKDSGGTLNGGVDTFTQTFNVTLNAIGVVDITSSAGNNPIELGQTVTLTATGGTSYLWSSATGGSDFINGNSGASVVVKPGKTIFNPQGAGGTYAGSVVYTVTAINAGGCPSAPKSITVTTYSAAKLVTNNVITPNGDGINDTWNIVNIEFYKTNNVKVFDKAGKIVFAQSGYLNTWDGSYNGTPLTQGTYQYVVDLGNGVKYTGYISIVRD